jgi:hypothetical protein
MNIFECCQRLKIIVSLCEAIRSICMEEAPKADDMDVVILTMAH